MPPACWPQAPSLSCSLQVEGVELSPPADNHGGLAQVCEQQGGEHNRQERLEQARLEAAAPSAHRRAESRAAQHRREQEEEEEQQAQRRRAELEAAQRRREFPEAQARRAGEYQRQVDRLRAEEQVQTIFNAAAAVAAAVVITAGRHERYAWRWMDE